MRGWYGNKQRHRMASKGIRTKYNNFYSKGELVENEKADIFDIIEFLKSTNHEKEVGVVTTFDGTVVSMDVGIEQHVTTSFDMDDYTQKDYHSHPHDVPPSLKDIYNYLITPQIQESWVVTPNYVYMMSFKNSDSVFKDLSYNDFENGFWDIFRKTYGEEYSEEYDTLSLDEQSAVFENLLHEFVTPDNLWIDKYEIENDGTISIIKEMR